MKKRLTALLLGFVLCLSLVGTAFASEEAFEPAEYDGKAEITAEPGGTEAVIYIEGLTAGRAYYGWSLMLIRDGAPTPITLYNPKAGALEDGSGYWKKTVRNLEELRDGDILRLNMADIGMFFEQAVGEEKPVEYTVTLDANGGTVNGKPADTLTTTGGKLANVPTPKRSGCKFLGWFDSKDGGGKVDFAKAVFESDATVYAHWEKIQTPDKPVGPDKPVAPSRPSGGSSGGRDDRDDKDTSSPVTVKRPSHGTVTASPSDPKKGDTVTITVRPDSGYELATLTVRRSGGGAIATTKVSDTEYTFTMPAGNVIIEATFRIKTETPAAPSFPDVPVGYTFYGDITWAASRGYMAGYGDGTFRPTANTTRQALWMVLGRMAGASPADMAAARSWALQAGVSDGTNGGSGMTRQQMVTMLYRYAQQRGYKVSGSANLADCPDGGSVAGYAREAMGWAVANGIVQGTADGRLNPGGVATRAHFAAFLHRFCQTVGIA